MNTGLAVQRAAVMLSLVAAGTANPARADEGIVIWQSHECGYFILQMKAGYGLFEWLAGPYPNDSDVIEGELKEPGEHRVNNKTADVPTTIFLDTFSEKRAAISARMPASCKAKPDYKPFEGP